MTSSDTPVRMNSRTLAYARVSTTDQDPQLQLDALEAAGRDDIYTDYASGTASARPELDALLRNARGGDTILVWRLDRLGRNVKHLVELVGDLETRGIGLRSLNEQIDTTTANGRLIFHVFAALAEFEAGLLSERTRAGLQAAKARGRTGGRPAALSSQGRQVAIDLRNQGKPISEIAEILNVSRATIYRALETTG